MEHPEEGKNVENTAAPEKAKGNFLQSMLRNPKAIKASRAESIHEETQLKYQSRIDLLKLDIKKQKRSLADMLDLSPDNALSLKLAEDFDSEEFVDQQIVRRVQIRQNEIKLEEAVKGYVYLFGEEPR